MKPHFLEVKDKVELLRGGKIVAIYSISAGIPSNDDRIISNNYRHHFLQTYL